MKERERTQGRKDTHTWRNSLSQWTTKRQFPYLRVRQCNENTIVCDRDAVKAYTSVSIYSIYVAVLMNPIDQKFRRNQSSDNPENPKNREKIVIFRTNWHSTWNYISFILEITFRSFKRNYRVAGRK